MTDVGDIADVSAAVDVLPELKWPLPHGDLLVANLDIVCARIGQLLPDAPRLARNSVRLDSPVANPGKIIAAPVNYHKHLDEARKDTGINFGTEIKTIDDLGLFLKAPSSLIGCDQTVLLPPLDRRMDHEIELAVIIGKPGFEITREAALDHVAGYAIALDMTIRGPEDRSWRKSFDTFSVLGPSLVTPDEVPDPDNLDFTLRVNGEVRQRSSTKALIFDVRKLIERASFAYRLHPGDVIMTGTPEGVAPVGDGDVMECRIESVGEMSVRVGKRHHAAAVQAGGSA
ncbi:fumarylacetoacetate hydrolase family protein [Nitratireductor kimnyeongensis]|uniref:Fumarylacetoacetate hydrolase family protein n=2 Tax=Nitratireductor kimnyeongensis TaxID=430679 RepID=A0ABW0T7M0_9HYPH|nr:fumarylacetoacetate hydrolase family protein [Nitratireductor kimnyeongensis]